MCVYIKRPIHIHLEVILKAVYVYNLGFYNRCISLSLVSFCLVNTGKERSGIEMKMEMKNEKQRKSFSTTNLKQHKLGPL